MSRINISKLIETETGHRLTNYGGKCAHLHGHRYQWEVRVSAPELDHTGFIIDYGDLKRVLTRTIDQIDHAFIFHDRDPLVLIALEEDRLDLLAATNGDQGRIFIVPFNPTSENLLPWMAERINEDLGRGGTDHVRLEYMRLWETSGSFAEWWAD